MPSRVRAEVRGRPIAEGAATDRPDRRQGPWQPPEPAPVSRDQAELDALLDKISASGMDSLTDHEREQLLVLRDRLRRR